MALIEDAVGRRKDQTPSGYTRLFGNAEVGNLMSRAHGACISQGIELEEQIYTRTKKINDFDEFIKNLHDQKAGVWVARTAQIKVPKGIPKSDFIAFDLTKGKGYVIELKDGDQFDTKKSEGEAIALHKFVNYIPEVIPKFPFNGYICSFNANTKEEVFEGLKGKFEMDEVLTGRELCSLLEIDYDDITRARQNDQQSNLSYFVDRVSEIDPVVDAPKPPSQGLGGPDR